MRARLAAVIAIAVIGRAAPARAQLGHDLPPVALTATAATTGTAGGEHDHMHGHEHGGLGFGLGVRLEAATTAIDGLPAEYQGIALHAHLHAGPIVLAIHAPAYRLESDRETYVGIGDIHLEAWLRALRRPGLALGAGIPVGLPTGSDDHLLGMGHVMIMPAAFAAIRRGGLDAIVVGSYHRALGVEAGHHHHGSQGPAVAPMSTEELAAAARVTYWLAPDAGAVAEAAVAIPLITADTRAAAGLGARWRRGRYDVAVVVQLGLAGDPFTARGVVELHVTP